MEDEDPRDGENPLDEHSLPGTNQAGKGPGSCDGNDQENRPRGGGATHQDQLEEHSLPGTNQAGKGPASCDSNDEQHADFDERHAGCDEQRRRAVVPHRAIVKSLQDP